MVWKEWWAAVLKINILCAMQKASGTLSAHPLLAFFSVLNLTTKWISPPIALTREDGSGSAPSGEMSPWLAICNANHQALAPKIDVPCKKVLSCWTGAEWKWHRSLRSLEWLSEVTRQGWGRDEAEPFCTIHSQHMVLMHLNLAGATKSGLRADGISGLG